MPSSAGLRQIPAVVYTQPFGTLCNMVEPSARIRITRVPPENEKPPQPADVPARPLAPAAQRALEEAEVRRRARTSSSGPPKELGGRQGPDPVRYGDWENGGIASDF